MTEMQGVETTTTIDPNMVILPHLVGDLLIPCDWSETKLHQGIGDAQWVAFLNPCVCGRTGARLICTHCKDAVIQTEDCAECGMCGEVYSPFRRVINHIEPLDRKP